MRKAFYLAFIGILLSTACTKEGKDCKTYTELTETNHLIDISPLISTPVLFDTLTKYPQLQVFRIINDSLVLAMHCNVFYDGVILLNGGYALFNAKKQNYFFGSGSIPTDINISLTPSIPYTEAINLAKQNISFNTCISYRLGIYNLNVGGSNQLPDYKLAWKIQGEFEKPIVILDANSGQVYSVDDGRVAVQN